MTIFPTTLKGRKEELSNIWPIILSSVRSLICFVVIIVGPFRRMRKILDHVNKDKVVKLENCVEEKMEKRPNGSDRSPATPKVAPEGPKANARKVTRLPTNFDDRLNFG